MLAEDRVRLREPVGGGAGNNAVSHSRHHPLQSLRVAHSPVQIPIAIASTKSSWSRLRHASKEILSLVRLIFALNVSSSFMRIGWISGPVLGGILIFLFTCNNRSSLSNRLPPRTTWRTLTSSFFGTCQPPSPSGRISLPPVIVMGISFGLIFCL